MVHAFQAAVNDTEILLPKYTSLSGTQGFDPEAIPARRRFLARRVKLLKNMLRWRKFTGEMFGLDRLVSRLIENCFMSVAEGGWDVGGEETARMV